MHGVAAAGRCSTAPCSSSAAALSATSQAICHHAMQQKARKNLLPSSRPLPGKSPLLRCGTTLRCRASSESIMDADFIAAVNEVIPLPPPASHQNRCLFASALAPLGCGGPCKVRSQRIQVYDSTLSISPLFPHIQASFTVPGSLRWDLIFDFYDGFTSVCEGRQQNPEGHA